MLKQATKHTRERAVATGLVSVAFAMAAASAASAQESAPQKLEPSPGPASATPDPIAQSGINDDDPESSVMTTAEAMKNPLNMGYRLMALADRADAAAKRGDHAKEAKYYRAIVKSVPERSVGYRRACLAHDAAHEWEKAVEMCRGALGAGGVTVDDHLAFVKVLLKKPEALSAEEIADADAVVERLNGELKLGKDEAGRKLVADAKCQIGAKLEDPTRLAACTELLRELKAEPAKLFTYDWALALSEGDAGRAREVIESARKAGLPPAALEAMERGLTKAKNVPAKAVLLSTWRRWWPALLASVLALALFAVLKSRRSRVQPV